MIKNIVGFIAIFLPWRIKRWVFVYFWKYDIHPTAYIGLAWIYPKQLIMGEKSRIDHFTVAIHLDKLELSSSSFIGRSNWITGFPTGTDSKHFSHQKERQSVLRIGNHSAITKHHHIDCTNSVRIGNFVTIAGYQSQFLTHSIDVYENRQNSKPIVIGDYCFVSTNCVILGGAVLPSYSVLGAKSLLNKTFTEEWKLYAGAPAKMISDISKDAKYFSREVGYVY